jgi:peptidoglycan hydrolase-like protein with peptidoglycan-binding domain
MKRLIVILAILGIIAYATVHYLEDRRFNPPSKYYDFPVSEQIDTEFYNPNVIKEYYGTILEIGNFARSSWNYDGVDVLSPDYGKTEDKLKAKYYAALRQTAMMLEDKLEESKRLKDLGYNNEQIKMLMEQGLTEEDLLLREKSYLLGLARGANGATVWELQKLLNIEGDSIPEDGIFNLITTNRLKEFQNNNNLFPSGEVDLNTLKALLK